ncbi:MAG TPA: serine hydrolase [Eudoraea sp.]|nr:serine hydrolase [Eudoraea sp.]
MNTYIIVLLSILSLLFTCKEQIDYKNPLTEVLNSENPDIRRVMDSVDKFEVQIRYTRIDREDGRILFTDFDFQVDEKNYFYPASTVKLPIAALALEKLNELDSLTKETRFYIEGDTVENSFATDVSKIFSISDNHANNRLFEFLGQDAINTRLKDKGVSPARISHRLGQHSDDVTTKPLVVYLNDSTTTTTIPLINSEPEQLLLNRIKKGSGFYENDSLIPKAFDFSLKNYYPIAAQHEFLKRIIFPETFEADQQIHLNASQRELILTAMHTPPRKLGYDPEEYYDGYCKFFIYGDTRENIPEHIQIYNKVGFAYGTLTDCAYITDTKNDVEFLLVATILVNKDGIFNDDVYEYDDVGIPFLAALGREVYKTELNRKKE